MQMGACAGGPLDPLLVKLKAVEGGAHRQSKKPTETAVLENSRQGVGRRGEALTGPDAVRFQNDHGKAATGQLTCGNQTVQSRADDDYFGIPRHSVDDIPSW